MAAYSSYAYRGKPHEDEWDDSTIYCEDGVCRTVIVEPDGRKTTAVGCSPFHETVSNWVPKSETTEHFYRAPVVEYRHNKPKPYGDAPTTWRPNTNAHTNAYGGYNNKPTTENYPIRKDQYNDYYRKERPTQDWDRPVNHVTRPVGHDAKLGVPTNSIEEAIDFLKGENTKISPVTGINHGGGGNQTHYGRPYGQRPRVYEEEDIPSRHQYPASSARPRTSSPPTYGHEYPPGVIDSNEAAKIYGGKIVRI